MIIFQTKVIDNNVRNLISEIEQLNIAVAVCIMSEKRRPDQHASYTFARPAKYQMPSLALKTTQSTPRDESAGAISQFVIGQPDVASPHLLADDDRFLHRFERCGLQFPHVQWTCTSADCTATLWTIICNFDSVQGESEADKVDSPRAVHLLDPTKAWSLDHSHELPLSNPEEREALYNVSKRKLSEGEGRESYPKRQKHDGADEYGDLKRQKHDADGREDIKGIYYGKSPPPPSG